MKSSAGQRPDGAGGPNHFVNREGGWALRNISKTNKLSVTNTLQIKYMCDCKFITECHIILSVI